MEINRELAARVLEVVDAGLVKGVGEPQPGQMCVEAAVCFATGLPHGDEPTCVAPALRSLKIRLNDSNWSSNAVRAKGLRRLALAQLDSADALDEQKFRHRVVDYALRVSTPKALRIAASVCKHAEHRQKLLDAAARCESEASRSAAQDANRIANAAAAAYAAYAAAYAAAAYAAYADVDSASAYTYAAVASAAAASASADAAADAAASAASASADAASASAAVSAARDKSLAGYAEAVVQILIDMKAPGCQWLDLAPIEVAA